MAELVTSEKGIPRRRRRIPFRYILPPAGLILLLAWVWILIHQPVTVQLVEGQVVRDPGRYAGADSCRSCHAEVVHQQSASNHAQTIRDLRREKPRAPFTTGQEVLDPLTGVRYSARQQGQEYHLAVESGTLKASQRLDWEFGAGFHAQGYLMRMEDGTWIDARLNYYGQLARWDFTSSQDKPQKYLLDQPLGKPRTPDEALGCFACHGTVIKADPPSGKTAAWTVRPERSVLNVTCESCHGPRAEHVKLARSGRLKGPEQTWTADEMNRVCGRCHGLTGIEAAHPVIARFQPWGLSKSRCFQASSGRLSCATCHDSHGNAERKSAFYEAKCLGCHTAPAQQACPVNKTSGCVGCHMPADSKSFRNVTFTDHRIRVLAGQQGRGREAGSPARSGVAASAVPTDGGRG